MFDTVVMESMDNSTLLCGQKVRFFTDLVDQAFTIGPAGRKLEIINAFGGQDVPNIEHFDFMYMVADVFTGHVQHGNSTGLCDALLKDGFNLDPVGYVAKMAMADGLAPNEYDAGKL